MRPRCVELHRVLKDKVIVSLTVQEISDDRIAAKLA